MTSGPPTQAKFPGGWETAPEITGQGGYAHAACSCLVEHGKTYCCRLCARATEETADCACGHAGCTTRTW